jgi:uncharacterized protein with von Willebrand factor type A (vWA) domain
VRTHRPRHVAALDEFFAAYGHRPGWAERRAAMIAGCRALVDVRRRWRRDPGE